MQALLIIALAPAVCEEALFSRLFLLGSQKTPSSGCRHHNQRRGIWHLSSESGQVFHDRTLGVLFCYVVYRTGSIFLTALMHFLNNAVAVFVLFYPEKMERLFPFLFHENPVLPKSARACGCGRGVPWGGALAVQSQTTHKAY